MYERYLDNLFQLSSDKSFIIPRNDINTFFHTSYDCFNSKSIVKCIRSLLQSNNRIIYVHTLHIVSFCLLLTIYHSWMTLQSINELDLMIYDTIDGIECKFQEINDKYCRSKTHIDRNIQCHGCMHGASIHNILILIMALLGQFTCCMLW